MFAKQTTSSSQTVYHKYTGDIEVGVKSQRQHRLVQLCNGMRVLCISDPEAKQSVASVCVDIGSCADPSEFQGLAHMLEHLVFMGTAKYPEPNDFDTFISQNAGYSNAETSGFMTWYHLAIRHDAFGRALDRLAQFFVSPLLECNEVSVVHAEFEETLGNDTMRFQHLSRALSKEGGHPVGQFRAGNHSTLNNAEATVVRRFFDKYYSADAMHLVVLGALSLDQMTEMAVNAFSEVPSKGDTRIHVHEHPLSDKQLGTLVRFQTLGDVYILDISFAVPDMRMHYTRNVEDYVAGILCLDGAESLVSLLRERGWANSIRVSYSDRCTAEFGGIFHVGVTCTPEGFRRYEDVVALVFGCIEAANSGGPLEWFYRELETLDRIAQVRALSSDLTEWVVKVSQGMGNPYLDPSHVITGTLQTCYRFDGQEIERFMSFLRPSNCRVMLGARNHGIELESEEPHFGIKYRIEKLVSSLNTANCTDVFCLPTPNEFLVPVVPHDNHEKYARKPELVRSTGQCELWVAEIRTGVVSFNTIYLYVENPVSGQSAQTAMCMRLFAVIVRDWVNEQLQQARRAGMEYSVSAAANGLTIRVSGIQPMALLLLVLQRILGILRRQPDIHEFLKHKEARKRYYANLDHQTAPSEMATWYPEYLTKRDAWHYSDCLRELETLEYSKFLGFVNQLFVETRLVMLITGALAKTEAEAHRILDESIAALAPTSPISDFHRPRELAHELYPGTYQYHVAHKGVRNTHNALCYTVHVGTAGNSRRSRAMAMLLAHMARRAFFDQMRTKEQLGYAATCMWVGPGKAHGTNALRFVVQGASNPWFIRLRIEAFLHAFRYGYLDTLSDCEFAQTVQSVDDACRGVRVEQMAARFWAHIEAGHYDFDQTAAVCTQLHSLRLVDLIEFWDTFVQAQNAQRRIVVHVWAHDALRQPSGDIRLYAVPVLALHSCLASLLDNNTYPNVTLQELDEFVRGCARNQVGTGKALNKLRALIAHFPGEEGKEKQTSQLQCALEMALAGAADAEEAPQCAPQWRLENAEAWRTESNDTRSMG
ncbi:metalloprotease [Coemansia sp. RSA 1646]|nr:metalloprotease [Coemansia sp. RSA 1646]